MSEITIQSRSSPGPKWLRMVFTDFASARWLGEMANADNRTPMRIKSGFNSVKQISFSIFKESPKRHTAQIRYLNQSGQLRINIKGSLYYMLDRHPKSSLLVESFHHFRVFLGYGIVIVVYQKAISRLFRV